jgi:hypothetical protein
MNQVDEDLDDIDVVAAENDPADSDDDSILKKKYDELTRQIFPQKIELPISAIAQFSAQRRVG